MEKYQCVRALEANVTDEQRTAFEYGVWQKKIKIKNKEKKILDIITKKKSSAKKNRKKKDERKASLMIGKFFGKFGKKEFYYLKYL